MEGKKTRQSIVKAFNAAIEGKIYTFKKERNMKIHYCVALVILISSLYLGFSKIEMILLLFTISLVVISEMFNTFSPFSDWLLYSGKRYLLLLFPKCWQYQRATRIYILLSSSLEEPLYQSG